MLRSGESSSANDFVNFLEDTLSRFGNKKVGLVRLDSGFCQKQIMDYLEEKKLNYILAAKFAHPVQQLIDKTDFWLHVDQNIEICEKTYHAGSWEKPRQIVIVKQRIAERPDAGGKMLSLFPEDEIHRNYRYSAYLTNTEYGMTDVWRVYLARGDAETGSRS